MAFGRVIDLRNNTTSEILIEDIGVVLPANASAFDTNVVRITDFITDDILDGSADLRALIESGDVSVNGQDGNGDGTAFSNLAIDQSLDEISITLVEPTVNDFQHTCRGGLNVEIRGGIVNYTGTIYIVVGVTLTLEDNSVNYVFVNPNGEIDCDTTGFPIGAYVPLYVFETSDGEINDCSLSNVNRRTYINSNIQTAGETGLQGPVGPQGSTGIQGPTGAAIFDADQCAVQVRRNTDFDIPTDFTDVPFQVTDIATDDTVLEHSDTNRDRIEIKKDGLYYLAYDFSIESPLSGQNSIKTVSGRIRQNDSTIVPGSMSETEVMRHIAIPGSKLDTHLSNECLYELSAGDFITVQLDNCGDGDDLADVKADRGTFKVIKLCATQGPQGETGPAGGPQGDTGLRGPTGPQGVTGPGGGGDCTAVDYYENGTTTVTDSNTIVDFDSVRKSDPVFSLSNGEATCGKDGTYLVLYDITTNSNTSNDTTLEFWIEKNGSEVAGTRSRIFCDNYDEDGSGSGKAILDLEENDVVRIRGKRVHGYTNINTRSDGSRLTIIECGSVGPEGPQGSTGPAGGPQGPTGIQGATGAGGSSTFGSQFYQNSSDSESSTTSGYWQTKLTLTTDSLPSGTYRLGYTFEVSNGSNGVLTEIEVKLDGDVVANPTMESDNDFLLFGGFAYATLSGVVTATIKYKAQSGTAKIRRARLELWRVS